ncbi:MAG: hypothetical protein LIO79_05065 [Rikenellaceae bacterium]|nr:hypothetical protein [Rikenellaceae bacterium]
MIKKGFDIFEDKNHQIYQVRNGIDDTIAIEFHDEEEKKIFECIIQQSKKEPKIHVNEVISNLTTKFSKEKIYNVINELTEFDLIEEENLYSSFSKDLEAQLSLWSLNTGASSVITARQTQEKIINTNLVIIGSGISLKYLIEKSTVSGFEKITIIDLENEVDNQSLERKLLSSDLIIFDANRWSPYYLNFVNELAVANNLAWILFSGVQGFVAKIGPLFIGKETGCYNCFISRIKSNMNFVPYFNQFEKHLLENKASSQNTGGPIVLYDIAASICVLEAIKYVTECSVPVIYKNMITMNLYGYETKIHNFLKAPVCTVCTPRLERNSAPWLEPVTLKN